jgi:cytochrome c553
MHRITWMLALIIAVSIAPQAQARAPKAAGKPTEPVVHIFASPVEVKAGRAIAEQSCAECHGVDGLSIEDGVPHLASQHADYLYAQLRAYKDGRRKKAQMRRAIQAFNDEALRNVAAYYFSLDLPYTPDPQQAAGSAAQRASMDDVSPEEAGKAASTGCASCHGKDGNSILPGMPSLAGQNLEYLVNATKAYREASRKDPMMRPAVALLNDDTIDNLALYYALQTPKATPMNAGGDASVGEAVATACAECHGADGNSTKPDTPSLAGQDPRYLIAATQAYKEGSRDHSAMQSIVAPLSDDDINNVAAYYAASQPEGGTARKPLTTAQWAERCDRCHGLNGNSTDPQIPSISGQGEEYLAMAMTAYREQDRGNTIMRAMLKPMKDVEINNLARHYTGKKRKSVVFVRVPCK